MILFSGQSRSPEVRSRDIATSLRLSPENGKEMGDQLRSSSLIPVLERVWASTVLTITAQ